MWPLGHAAIRASRAKSIPHPPAIGSLALGTWIRSMSASQPCRQTDQAATRATASSASAPGPQSCLQRTWWAPRSPSCQACPPAPATGRPPVRLEAVAPDQHRRHQRGQSGKHGRQEHRTQQFRRSSRASALRPTVAWARSRQLARCRRRRDLLGVARGGRCRRTGAGGLQAAVIASCRAVATLGGACRLMRWAE